MRRLALLAAAPLAAVFAGALVPAPAAAQDAPGDKVNIVDVFGDDPCPPSAGDEIVVCRRLDEEERYRIPEALRQSDSPQNQSWSQRVRSFETVGDFGPLSCSPIGLGGELGCTAEMIAAAYEERRTGSGVRASEIIAAQRAERLSLRAFQQRTDRSGHVVNVVCRRRNADRIGIKTGRSHGGDEAGLATL